jgi:hypothetical protein
MNMKNFRPGSEHPDPTTPGLYIQMTIDGCIALIHRFTDGEFDYGEYIGALGATSLRQARAYVRAASVCPI